MGSFAKIGNIGLMCLRCIYASRGATTPKIHEWLEKERGKLLALSGTHNNLLMLEKKGLLTSDLEVDEARPHLKRRRYDLTPEGQELLAKIDAFNNATNPLLVQSPRLEGGR